MPLGNCALRIAGRHDARTRVAGHVLRWLAVTGLVLLAAAPGVLGWRRLAGALRDPLCPAALIGVGVAVAAGAAGVRLALRHAQQTSAEGRARWAQRAVAWGVPLAVLGVGTALSLPQSPLPGLAALWSVLLAGEGWAWFTQWRHRPAASSQEAGDRPSWPERPEGGPSASMVVAQMVPLFPAGHAAPEDDVLQQMLRRRGVDGSEEVSGWVRVALARSQRTANVHLAFCPPFARTPQLAVEQLEGPEVRIKKVQTLPYGARFDLKLAEPSEEPVAALLQFSARCGPPTSANVDPPAPENDHA